MSRERPVLFVGLKSEAGKHNRIEIRSFRYYSDAVSVLFDARTSEENDLILQESNKDRRVRDSIDRLGGRI